jgi:SAM-dependent methyltransferase
VNVHDWNRDAWDRAQDRWTKPVAPEVIADARRGIWNVLLTPTKPVPAAWFPPLAQARVLGLASGGGQQMPIFAALGAQVTSFDASPKQLARDREVAARDGLALETVQGDMRALPFADASFDLVFHPCSNCFVEEIRPVWREAARVLRPGGALLAGFCNPVIYAVDEATELTLTNRIPYSDVAAGRIREGQPLEFGHSLEDQLGGQLDAGLVLTALYEDVDATRPHARILPGFIATRAVKS